MAAEGQWARLRTRTARTASATAPACRPSRSDVLLLWAPRVDAVSSLPVVKEEEAAATPRSKSSTPGPAPAAGGGGGAANIYFRSFEFSPSVPIRIDYVGKYVDLTQGVLTGILAGLAQLNCSELTLPQLHLKVELHNMFFSPD